MVQQLGILHGKEGTDMVCSAKRNFAIVDPFSRVDFILFQKKMLKLLSLMFNGPIGIGDMTMVQ